MINVRDFDFTELESLTNMVHTKNKKGDVIRYLNYPFCFDIETTSFKYTFKGEQEPRKAACMYIWQMSVNGTIVYGRTWNQFQWFLEELQIRLKLDYYNRMIIYIHNLSYEFQFLIGKVIFKEVFSRKKRHPIKALANDSFELRCSYFLSGLSLEKLAEDLTTIQIAKKVDDLDYSKIRHSETPLTDKELDYCEYDVKILHYFILEEMHKNNDDISNIPLTKTGYARRYCRNYIKNNTNYKKYRERIMQEAPLNEDLFILLNKAFAGGYTHANCLYIDEYKEFIDNHVHSIDFTSSYPAQMIMHKYPRGKFEKIIIDSEEAFNEYINKYACVFEITIKGIEPKSVHHIWSVSKCSEIDKESTIVDNGRIVESKQIRTFMTDVDFKTFDRFYKCKSIIIHNFYYTQYDYLPKAFIECILKLYSDKTTLKGIKEKAEEYLVAKGLLNALYGMCVTNPLNDELEFDEEYVSDKGDKFWSKTSPDITAALNKSYSSMNQFLCYQWGVWVTAWARYELLYMLNIIDRDGIYCDTDSIKMINYKSHIKDIEAHNTKIKNALEKTLITLRLDTKLLNPIDIKGNHHFLGIWDYEGEYQIFKTLGAKRYAYVSYNKDSKENEFHITVSGLYNKVLRDSNNKIITTGKHSKNPTVYIMKHGLFDFFKDGMEIPVEYSKRLTHSYIDEPFTCNLTDYNNKTIRVHEDACIHLEAQPYTCGLSDDFIEYLIGTENSHFIDKLDRPEVKITTRKI